MTDNAENLAQEKPELVVDEDWKSQVQAEKQAAEATAEVPPADADDAPTAASTEAPAQESDAEPPPPASFSGLISMLAVQAAAALGQLPDPEQGHPVIRPDLAKHFIDLLGILDTKTQGNLTDQENRMLNGILSELRLAFVSIQSRPPTTD